jgi:aliphatic nitrilase
VVAGPTVGNEELILYADMDLEIGVRMKLRHDLAGHYNRPDVFRLLINRTAAPLVHEVSAGELAEPHVPIIDYDDPAALPPGSED